MVNLERAKDRRQHMREELSAAGIKCIFTAGVDFLEYGEDRLLEECRADGPFGDFQLPHMAATLSHIRIWQRFLETDSDVCLVFEDDIHISPDLKHWLLKFDWWPADADVVKIEHWRERDLLILLDSPATKHLGREVSRLRTRHMGAAGYILTRRAASEYLAQSPFNVVIDHLLFNQTVSKVAKRLNIYQINPALVVQGNNPPEQVYFMPPGTPRAGWSKHIYNIKRGIYEFKYPLAAYWCLITGNSKLQKNQYVAKATFFDPVPGALQAKIGS